MFHDFFLASCILVLFFLHYFGSICLGFILLPVCQRLRSRLSTSSRLQALSSQLLVRNSFFYTMMCGLRDVSTFYVHFGSPFMYTYSGCRSFYFFNFRLCQSVISPDSLYTGSFIFVYVLYNMFSNLFSLNDLCLGSDAFWRIAQGFKKYSHIEFVLLTRPFYLFLL